MYRIVILTILWMVSASCLLQAQSISVESRDVFEDAEVCLDITVDGFDAVTGFEFRLRWDTTILEYLSTGNYAVLPNGASPSKFDDDDVSDPSENLDTINNYLIISYFDFGDLVNNELPDGSVLMQVCFRAIGDLGDISTIDLYNQQFFDTDLRNLGFGANDGTVRISNAVGDNLSFDFPTISVDSGINQCVPLRVVNFEDLTDFEFGIKWDANVISYSNHTVDVTLLEGFSNANLRRVGLDSIHVSWNDSDGSGETLVQGSTLFNLCFNTIGSPAESSLLAIQSLNARDLMGPILDVDKTDGLVIINSPPVAEDLILVSPDQEVIPGARFCSNIQVRGFRDVSGLSFNYAWDSSILSFSRIENLVSLPGLSSANINTATTSSGNLVFEWQSPDGTGETLRFNETLFSVCFEAVGSDGSMSNLEARNIIATNADGLDVTEQAENGIISIANPAAEIVEFYLDTITINHGNEGCLSLKVNNYENVSQTVVDIDFNQQNLTFLRATAEANIPGFEDSNISMPSMESFNINWSDANGIGRTLSNNTEFAQFCFQADGNDIIRDFTISNIEIDRADGMDVNTMGRSGRIIVPDTSMQSKELGINPGTISMNISEEKCFPVNVVGFDELIDVEFQVEWDPSLFRFTEFTNLASLSNLTLSSLTNPSSGVARFNWEDDDPTVAETLTGGTILFNVCGEGLASGISPINITNRMAQDANGNVATVSNSGEIQIRSGSASDLRVYADSETVDVNDEVCIPIKVDNFTDVLSADMKLTWDASIISYDRIDNLAMLPGYNLGSFSTPPSNGSDNRIILSWFDGDDFGQYTLPNGTTLFRVCFDAISEGVSPIDIYDQEFLSDVNGTVVPSFDEDGEITVGSGGGGPARDGFRIEVPEVETNTDVTTCVPLYLHEFRELISMNFELGWDSNIATFNSIQNLYEMPGGSGIDIAGPPNIPADDRINVFWLDDNLTNRSLPDSVLLFDICLDITGSIGDMSVLDVRDAEFFDETEAPKVPDLYDGKLTIVEEALNEIELHVNAVNLFDEGQSKCVPIQIDNFVNVASLGFQMEWNSTFFSFDSVTNLAAVDALDQSDFTSTSGSLVLDWMESDGGGESLAPNAALFEACFTAIGLEGDSSLLLIENVMAEDANMQELNSTTTPGVLRINEGVKNGELVLSADFRSGDKGDQVCTKITAEYFTDIAEMSFHLAWDGDVVSFNSIQNFAPLPSFGNGSIIDPNEQAIGDKIIVDWEDPISRSSLSTPSDLFEVCFDLTGDEGTISPVGFESVIIEDEMNEEISFSTSDGRISINLNPLDSIVYLKAPRVEVDPGEELCLDITVQNYKNILSTETAVVWDPNVLSFVRIENIASLPYLDINQFSTPMQTMVNGRLKMAWADEDGAMHDLNDDDILFTTCFDVVGSPGSTSTVNFVNIEISSDGFSALPSSSLSGFVKVNNVEIETIGLNIEDAELAQGDTVCVPVSVTDFMAIDELNLDLQWEDLVLDYVAVENLGAIPGLTQADFTHSGSSLSVAWANASSPGLSLGNGDIIFDVCFEGVGNEGSSSLVFLNDGNARNDVGDPLNIFSDNGKITIFRALGIADVQIQDATCFGDSTGVIDVNVVGGTPPYDYIWSPSQLNRDSIDGLSAGTYIVTISDALGSEISRSFVVREPSPLIVDSIISGVTPPGANGSIRLNVSGGTRPYSFDWCCSITADSLATDLEEGMYSVRVMDALGCTVNLNELEVAGGLMVTLVDSILPKCSDSDDGALSIAIEGGLPPYNIMWSDGVSTIGSSNDLLGLSAGEYFYEINDSSVPQNTAAGSFILGAPDPLRADVNIISETQAGADGVLSASASGGTAPYRYSWVSYRDSERYEGVSVSGLSSSYYRLELLDDNGCRANIDSIFLPGPLFISENDIVIDSISCNGNCDASITVNPSGGSGNYLYSFGGASTTSSNMASGFCAGQVIIIVEDEETEELRVLNAMISDPPLLIADANVIGVDMGNDGGIAVDVMGGTPPYNFLWNDGVITEDRTGLASGLYDVTITDDNDCQLILRDIEVAMRSLSLSDVEIENVSCVDDTDGFIEVDIEGGCLPYTYRWRTNSGNLVSEDRRLNNVGVGSYILQVIDDCDETLFSDTLTLSSNSQLQINIENLSNYNGFEVSGFDNNDGSVRVDIDDPTGISNIRWSNGQTTTVNANLVAGIYSVTVSDETGCSLSDTVLLRSPDPIEISFDIVRNNQCFEDENGIVTADVTGGVRPYMYFWSQGVSNGALVERVTGGILVLSVEDANGVEISDSIIMVSETNFDIESIIEPDRGNGEGSITLVVNGGEGPYEYNWGSTGQSNSSTLSNLRRGSYSVVVTDNNGCSEFKRFEVPLDVNAPECLEVREVFTPNGDNQNDEFVINCIEDFRNTIEIYNRFGDLVYEKDEYDNSWQGRDLKGELLPVGAYFYVLEIVPQNGAREIIKGHISLLR